jgi:hypothetical protein
MRFYMPTGIPFWEEIKGLSIKVGQVLIKR